MRKAGLTAVILSLAMLAAASAQAADPKTLFGRWQSKQPNGSVVVWNFSKTTNSYQSFSAKGEALDEVRSQAAVYQDIANTPKVGIAYPGSGGRAVVLIKTRNVIVLSFPGVGVYELTRIQQ